MAMYAYLDGDDIGLKIEGCLLSNNETTLRKVNSDLNGIIVELTTFLVSLNHQVIFSGADGIICKFEKIDINEIHLFLSKRNFPISFSIGLGHSLSHAFLALRFVKANGKNGTAILRDSFEWIERE